ncbi:MAG: hypothetical protein WBC76_09015 [Actinomycetes bacterium]
MKRLVRAVLLASLTGLVLLPATPVSAARADAPEIRWKLRSITLDVYSGTITVKARVRCSGRGTAEWSARAVQDVRARGTAEIICDGQRRRSKIMLDPANGSFRPGPVSFDIGLVACGKKTCTASGQSFTTRV